jgi:glucose-1-phosphate thymidylyltransferase
MGLRVIIPVAGVGSRLRPHTHTAPKVMLQVAGKPMLGHILDELSQYDVEEITLIIGHLGDSIRNYVTKAYNFKFSFVTQDELKGLGHAIWLTRDVQSNGDSPLLIILGDTIFDADFKTILGSATSYIGVKEVDDPRRFGVIELAGDQIRKMIEKPDKPPTNLAIVGIYYLTDPKLLFACLDELIVGGKTTKGEFQLTDALQMMIERGAQMKPFVINHWYDCGKPETLLETNRDLLARNLGKGPSHKEFDDSLIKPPVSIGEGVTIENSIVGPYVTVADGVTIRHSIIRDSILSNGATVENMLLDGSIIADNAKTVGKSHILNVGDSSDIQLG